MPFSQHNLYLKQLALFLIILILTACSPAQNQISDPVQEPVIPAGSCIVDPGVTLGAISPFVYGVNHGPWAVITEKTLPLAKDARITMIRFPGGNWGDENDLRPYHIDQFVFLARQMESEVSLNVRLHGGSPEKAAELVRYANIENDYDIRYWGIGNEPTLFATSRDEPDYGVDRFNTEWRAFAEAMKAVDGSILLIAPELHQFGSDIASTPKDPFGLDWMIGFLEANGDLVDYVSIHRYPFPQVGGGRAVTVEELMASSAEWDQIIPYLRGLILEKTGREIPIAVTEVNSHWSNATGGEATPDSFSNAIWWADVLGRMITNQVDIVNYFTLQSLASTGGYGLFSRSDPRPTYYVYKIYQEFGDTLIFSGCDNPDISIYAATGADGGLRAILVNLGAEDVTLPLIVEGEGLGLESLWRFDEANLLHELTLVDGLDPLQLPGYSITLLKFE